MVNMDRVQRKSRYLDRARTAWEQGRLTRREWQCLTLLMEYTDKDFRVVDSLRSISETVEWDQGNTVRLVQQLETKGWIFRKLGALALTTPSDRA